MQPARGPSSLPWTGFHFPIAGMCPPPPPAQDGGLQVYLLHVFGPVGRLGHGHEAAVGQDGAHDEQAEQREQVKEQQGLLQGSQLQCPIFGEETREKGV